MFYVKIVLVLFLLWISFLLSYLMMTYARKNSPKYYVAATGDSNPIQPRFQIPITKVKEHPKVLKVTLDSRGFIYLVQELNHGNEVGRIYYYHDPQGRLRYEGIPDFSGKLHLVQVSPPPD
jgi:hypothetical protein